MKSWRIVKFCVQLGRFTRALWLGELAMNEDGKISAVDFSTEWPERLKLKYTPEVAESVVAADSKSAG